MPSSCVIEPLPPLANEAKKLNSDVVAKGELLRRVVEVQGPRVHVWPPVPLDKNPPIVFAPGGDIRESGPVPNVMVPEPIRNAPE
jgi:hypothetical protein